MSYNSARNNANRNEREHAYNKALAWPYAQTLQYFLHDVLREILHNSKLTRSHALTHKQIHTLIPTRTLQ